MKRKIQVFVSSTFKDLVEERQAAVSAILKAGHIPAGMELFNAGDKSQLETIKRWIDESDAYMLILGGRYGSIEPISGKGYTEVEFDYAVSAGKPLFAVVISDEALEQKVKTTGSSVLEGDNPKLLRSFREKVLTNISSFFSDIKDIKLSVHESLSDLGADPRVIGWVSAADVEDTALLHDEIRTLRLENETLRGRVAQSEKVAAAKPKRDRQDEIDDIIQVIGDIDVTIPENLRSKKGPVVRKLLELFYSYRESLVTGVTNSIDSSNWESFFFFTLAPKLQIHGLMETEKITGVKYRRAIVSKFGLEVLAECERRIALNSKREEPEPSELT